MFDEGIEFVDVRDGVVVAGDAAVDVSVLTAAVVVGGTDAEGAVAVLSVRPHP